MLVALDGYRVAAGPSWNGSLRIAGALVTFAHVQRWFVPTMELYFYAPTATGLNRGMAVKQGKKVLVDIYFNGPRAKAQTLLRTRG